eukprot:Nitzschia sp. Nitz4//NODE_159_length_47236_cov_74.723851//26135//28045//NITZ4_additional_000010-RA//1//CDS//3329531749//8355//frame0
MDPMHQESSSETTREMMTGLLSCLSDRLTEATLEGAYNLLRNIPRQGATLPLREHTTSIRNDLEYKLGCVSVEVAQEMCTIGSRPTTKRKQNWDDLLQFAGKLQNHPVNEESVLSISLVFGALSLRDSRPNDAAKSAASALASTVSRNKSFRPLSKDVSKDVLKSYLIHASHSDTMDLQILTQFARAFRVTDEDDGHLAATTARAIRHALRDLDPNSMVEDLTESQKLSTAASLALSCQIRPWEELNPQVLVEAALPFAFWHAAEKVCQSAHVLAKAKKASYIGTKFNDESVSATEFLIDAAMEAKSFRRADQLATSLFAHGGKSRFVEARFRHACDTICRVSRKRMFPLIERQVERMDKSIAKVSGTLADADAESQALSQEIRIYAMNQLHELGEIQLCNRLSEMWGMNFSYDEKAILEAEEARRQRYLQFDEVLTGPIPHLVSTPAELRSIFDEFWKNGPYPKGPFGFDAEWDEESKGAELLQLSHPKQALLIDIPALSSTKDGVEALTETIGALFACPQAEVVGFSCHHDLSRLRGSPVIGGHHWLSGTQAVSDAQQLVGNHEPKLKQSDALGLSRVCQHYFGKPLDKSEQCSMWSTRPLSVRQRSYAALDAWVCAGVYEKLFLSTQTDNSKN